MIRFADFRLDGSSITTLPDGSIKVVGQLARPGIQVYRNPDGTQRREYRSPEEVFAKDAMSTFSMAPITVNHPGRMVTADSWKKDAVGHLGENVREDNGLLVADLFIRDAATVKRVKSGGLKHISCGYAVAYDPTPGVTPEGQRYDGSQRGIRSNHVALLPTGVAPRGGEECVLRLDSNGDEEIASKLDSMSEDTSAALSAQIVALTAELTKSRTDAADLVTVRSDLAKVQADLAAAVALTAPERLDALVEERSSVVAIAKAAGIETKGLSNLAVKRAIVAKRTPDLATRADSLDGSTVDAILAVYASQPHPSMAAVVAPVVDAAVRTDSTVAADGGGRIPTVSELHNKFAQASLNAWKNS